MATPASATPLKIATVASLQNRGLLAHSCTVQYLYSFIFPNVSQLIHPVKGFRTAPATPARQGQGTTTAPHPGHAGSSAHGVIISIEYAVRKPGTLTKTPTGLRVAVGVTAVTTYFPCVLPAGIVMVGEPVQQD